MPVGAQLLEHVDPALTGEHQVQHDQVVLARARPAPAPCCRRARRRRGSRRARSRRGCRRRAPPRPRRRGCGACWCRCWSRWTWWCRSWLRGVPRGRRSARRGVGGRCARSMHPAERVSQTIPLRITRGNVCAHLVRTRGPERLNGGPESGPVHRRLGPALRLGVIDEEAPSEGLGTPVEGASERPSAAGDGGVVVEDSTMVSLSFGGRTARSGSPGKLASRWPRLRARASPQRGTRLLAESALQETGGGRHLRLDGAQEVPVTPAYGPRPRMRSASADRLQPT